MVGAPRPSCRRTCERSGRVPATEWPVLPVPGQKDRLPVVGIIHPPGPAAPAKRPRRSRVAGWIIPSEQFSHADLANDRLFM